MNNKANDIRIPVTVLTGFLDEPTAGLDDQGQAALVDVLNRQRKSGRLILVATHDPVLAQNWAEETIALRL